MKTIDLATTTGKGVMPQVRAGARLDPYWDGLWSMGSSAAWVSVSMARRQQAAGLVTLPDWLDTDPDDALARFTDPTSRHRRKYLEFLGTIGSWRTMSAQQAAAFTGWPALTGHSPVVRDAFAAGLIDIGVMVNALNPTASSQHAYTLRPSRSGVFERHIWPHTTYAERVVLSGGGPYLFGGQYDRHNLLTSELALRLGEFTDVGTVLGETYASVDHLFGAGAQRADMSKVRKSGDAVIVREDGLRIVVETTASLGAYMRNKVNRWLELMSQPGADLRSSGVVVLFLATPHLDRSGHDHRELEAAMRRLIMRSVEEHRGPISSPTRDRIAFASWRDWFPARGKIAADFARLPVQMPNGPKGDPWADTNLMDVQFDARDRERAQAVITNSAAIASAPVWLRRAANPAPVWRCVMRDWSALARSVPSRGSTRDEQGWGVAGDRASLPERLSSVATADTDSVPRVVGGLRRIETEQVQDEQVQDWTTVDDIEQAQQRSDTEHDDWAQPDTEHDDDWAQPDAERDDEPDWARGDEQPTSTAPEQDEPDWAQPDTTPPTGTDPLTERARAAAAARAKRREQSVPDWAR